MTPAGADLPKFDRTDSELTPKGAHEFPPGYFPVCQELIVATCTMADVDARQVSLLQSVSLTELGARIKAARLAAGMTQTQLGAPEVTVSYVSRIESGRRRPDPRVLDAFAGRLGVPVEALLAGPPVADEQESRLSVDFVALALELGDAADALSQAERLLADRDVPATFAERLQLLRGRALEMLGRLDEAVQAYEELLAAYPAGEFALGCGIALSRCYREWGDLGRAISVGEKLLATVADRGLAGGDEAIQLTVTVAAAYHERGDVGHAVRLCRQAIAVAEESGSPRSRAAAYWNASMMELQAGEVNGAVALASKALALLGGYADARNLARLRSQLGIMQMQLDPPELDDAVANLSAAAQQMALSDAGQIDQLRNDLALAEAALMTGDVVRARDMAAGVFEQVPPDAPLLAADARTLQGQAAAAAGDVTAAAELFKHAVHLLTGVGADRGPQRSSGWSWPRCSSRWARTRLHVRPTEVLRRQPAFGCVRDLLVSTWVERRRVRRIPPLPARATLCGQQHQWPLVATTLLGAASAWALTTTAVVRPVATIRAVRVRAMRFMGGPLQSWFHGSIAVVWA